jgi:hypothetical protein
MFALASACSGMRISRYYWGANVHPDGGALVRPVPGRVDEDLQPFSEKCVQTILKGNVDGLRTIASGDLPPQLDDPSLTERLRSTSEKYALAGTFEQIDSTGGGLWMDEMISRDPYKLYDFFVTEFLLPGKTNAHAFLLIKRTGVELSLLGFDIHSAVHRGADPDVRLMPKALKEWRSLAPR